MKEFNSKISHLTLNHKFIRESTFLFPLFRLLRKSINPLGFDLAICRYQSTISLYSTKEDDKLYPSFIKGDLINVGAGGFTHKNWVNYDFPARTKLYKKIQGKLNKDFIPIDLNQENLRINSKSLKACYLSHILEHLPRENSIKAVDFFYKKLVKGGIIRIVLPDVENIFDNLKINYKNPKKNELIFLANKIFGKIEKNKYSYSEIKKIFVESNSCEDFYNKLLIKWPALNIPDKEHPEYHLGCWTKKFLLEKIESHKSFRNCIITDKNKSQFAPFINDAIFDTTESNNSIYLEIKKT